MLSSTESNCDILCLLDIFISKSKIPAKSESLTMEINGTNVLTLNNHFFNVATKLNVVS